MTLIVAILVLVCVVLFYIMDFLILKTNILVKEKTYVYICLFITCIIRIFSIAIDTIILQYISIALNLLSLISILNYFNARRNFKSMK
ncbi:MAG: hypothetical protein RR620_08890 [Clostridium sp.]